MSCSRRECTRATFLKGSNVPVYGEGTERGHGGADVLLEGLGLPVPTVPLNGQDKTWHLCGAGGTSGRRCCHGVWKPWGTQDQFGGFKDNRNCSSCHHVCMSTNQWLQMLFITQRETERVYYLHKYEIILCYLLKSHVPHHCKAKGRSWKRLHVPVPAGTLWVAANPWSKQ